VVLDCLSSHKVKGVLDPIYVEGVSVLFLLLYSPDLNPIELM
jgi:transposase